jgi:hypothetical protein
MLFPGHNTPLGRLLPRDRLLAIRETPSARFAIAPATETGDIISQAGWHYYPAEVRCDVMDLSFVEGTKKDKDTPLISWELFK